jgi:hypothetical protein
MTPGALAAANGALSASTTLSLPVDGTLLATLTEAYESARWDHI